MLESYGVLVLIGGGILLIIWIHGQQVRRPSRPVSGGRESVVPGQSLYAHRTADDPDYAELEEMSRESGLQTYRIEEIDLPCPALTFDRARQMEMLLQAPGENLLLILHAEFSESCPGEALHDLLSRAGLQLAEDGLYRKAQERDADPLPIYYVASHSRTGSFARQGKLIDALPQITFFTQLPLPVDGLNVFNGMLRVAEEVCDKFGGTLLDEENEPLTRAGTEALVQRVAAFESSRLNPDPALMH